jgi:hypothetical protein
MVTIDNMNSREQNKNNDDKQTTNRKELEGFVTILSNLMRISTQL